MSTSLTIQPNASNASAISFPDSASLFDEFQAISNSIAQRAFRLFQDRGQKDGHDLGDWLRAESELLKPVPIEVAETTTGFTVCAEVPGFDSKDLKVSATGNSVYIHGRNEQKKVERQDHKVKYSEFKTQEICRRVDLPAAIDPARISASLAKGVLELSLSKAEPAKPVEVKAA